MWTWWCRVFHCSHVRDFITPSTSCKLPTLLVSQPHSISHLFGDITVLHVAIQCEVNLYLYLKTKLCLLETHRHRTPRSISWVYQRDILSFTRCSISIKGLKKSGDPVLYKENSNTQNKYETLKSSHDPSGLLYWRYWRYHWHSTTDLCCPSSFWLDVIRVFV